MNRMTKIALIFLITTLAACNANTNLSRDNSVNYKSAKQFPEVEVPEITVPEEEPSDSDSKKNKR